MKHIRAFEILGLPVDASLERVRRRYKRLVFKWHPDRNKSPLAHGKVIEITDAKRVLDAYFEAPTVPPVPSVPPVASVPSVPPVASPGQVAWDAIMKAWVAQRSTVKPKRKTTQEVIDACPAHLRPWAAAAFAGAAILDHLGKR